MKVINKVKVIMLSAILFPFGQVLFSQIEDAQNCKDYPMFNRMPNTFIDDCSKNFNLVEIPMSLDLEVVESKEGTKTYIAYNYNYDSNVPAPSFYQIVKNYENVIVKNGGKKIVYSDPEHGGYATLYIKSGGKEIWIVINDHGGIGEGQFGLTILEIEAMKQDIIANDILIELNKNGFVALYINFESGKSAIQADSDTQIDQIVQMMKDNPSLKISIEGHTDNDGNEKSNQTLSEDRAKAVMNAMITKGIDKTRLSSKGWGQSKPIADNRSDDGKAKNRRVEIIKM